MGAGQSGLDSSSVGRTRLELSQLLEEKTSAQRFNTTKQEECLRDHRCGLRELIYQIEIGNAIQSVDCYHILAYLGCVSTHLKSYPKASRPVVKILFTSTHETSFIKEDVSLLRKSFEVDYLITSGVFAVPKIIAALLKADMTYTWFASVYASVVVLMARIFGKPSVIIVGGVDAARYPEIGYGIWLSKWKGILVRYAMRNAQKVLVVSSFLRKQIVELARYEGHNIECVPTGYDPSVWIPGEKGKEDFILTIAGCDTRPRVRIKGIPFLLDVARAMDTTRFTIIGPGGKALNEIRALCPPNVELISFLPRDQLRGYYQRARVYCQPSYFEGLPNSVCEAMLCECIPVGTDVGGIPTAIGDAGFVVSYGNVSAMVAALRRALAAPESLGKAARSRILEHFTLAKREAALKRILSELAGEDSR